jgi:hypothetical protein
MWKIACLTLLLSLPVYSQTNGKVDPLQAPPVVPNAQSETSQQNQPEPQTPPDKDGRKFTFSGGTFNFVDNMQSIIRLPRIVQEPGKGKACSIPLQQIPVPTDRNFTVRQVPPQQMDAGMVVKPAVPACDAHSSQAASAPAPTEEPKK